MDYNSSSAEMLRRALPIRDDSYDHYANGYVSALVAY